MGTDLTVVNAARVSFAKRADQFREQDGRLLDYLARHQHWTPFAHPQITLHVKAPIFVRTQCFKHKVGFVENEISRRYVDAEPEFYLPVAWRLKAEDKKQGSSQETIPVEGGCPICGRAVTRRDNRPAGGPAQIYCGDNCKRKAKDPFKLKFSNAKGRANREGTNWTIEFEDIEWPENCPILGMKLTYSHYSGKIQPNSPSFDRIDPTGSYTKGNVRIISHLANTMKSSADKNTLTTFAKSVLLEHYGFVFEPEQHGYLALINHAKEAYRILVEDHGVAPEMARMVLPQSMMTEWYWTGSLASWARFCAQRGGKDSQAETGEVASGVSKIIEPLFPAAWFALQRQAEG